MENFETLINSREFTNLVNQITNSYGVAYNDDIKNDVRQACAIAAWEAYQKYDPAKVGNNFWGYAYLRMRTYAKREIHEQKNIVHIPLNRTREDYSYEKVNHSYEDLSWEDGHSKPFESETNNVALGIDIEAALSILDEETRYIFEVHSELRKGNSDKSDFNTIAEELGIPVSIVRKRFNTAKEQIASFLR